MAAAALENAIGCVLRRRLWRHLTCARVPNDLPACPVVIHRSSSPHSAFPRHVTRKLDSVRGGPKSHPGGLRRRPGAPNRCQTWSRSSDQDCAHGDARAMGCPGRACTCRIACSGDPNLGPVAPPRCLGRPCGCTNEPRWPARASLAGNARAMVHSGACAMAGRGAAEGTEASGAEVPTS